MIKVEPGPGRPAGARSEAARSVWAPIRAALALGVLALLLLAGAGCQLLDGPEPGPRTAHQASKPRFPAFASEQSERRGANAGTQTVSATEQSEGLGANAQAEQGPWPAVLRVEGRHFVAPDGRVVILRGVNLLMGKCPPIQLGLGQEELDRVAALGFNAIRLPFIWEAYEPERGRYDGAYLSRMVEIASMAWTSGLYVIVDVHQDGFARTLTRGCGDGFPLWAVSPKARTFPPNNDCACENWALLQLTDPGLHRSFSEFYGDTHGVRTSYLAMLDRVVAAFSRVPGVIGYDPLNEPWGDERRQIAPLYRDAARVARARQPSAILFLEPRGPTAAGLLTWLPEPELSNVAYAPHYYYPLAIVRKDWSGRTAPISRAIDRADDHAAEWGAPLIFGEMGIPATARNAGKYVDYLYDQLDAHLASSLQWNIAPDWDRKKLDGWNREDFSLIDDQGRLRPGYRPRPCPQRVAGLPICFRYEEHGSAKGGPRLELVWTHRMGIGPTEIRVPHGLFPDGGIITVEPLGATCAWDEARRLLFADSPVEGRARVVLEQR